jgi:hypothetical protein
MWCMMSFDQYYKKASNKGNDNDSALSGANKTGQKRHYAISYGPLFKHV